MLEQRRGSTFHQHGLAQADEINQGRFAAVGVPHVVGSTPIPKYPELPASSPFHHDPVPNEPPLSAYENPALSAVSFPAAEQLGAPAAGSAPPSELTPPSADDVEPGAGASSSLGGPALSSCISPQARNLRDAGPSSKRRSG